MSEEAPTPGNLIYRVLDYSALGCILIAPEELARGGITGGRTLPWRTCFYFFAAGVLILCVNHLGLKIVTAVRGLIARLRVSRALTSALTENATLGRQLEQATQQVGELASQLEDEVKRSNGYVAQIASWQESEQESVKRFQGKLNLANTELYAFRAQESERLKRRKLEFRYDRVLTRTISSDNLRDGYVLNVGNIQKMVPVVSEYATARIRFSNEGDNSHFTVTRAMWDYRHEDERHITTGLHPWVHVAGAEEQAFVLLFKHLDGTLWAHDATETVPVGFCGTGRWTIEVSVMCDDAEPLVSTLQLKVYPDRQFKFSDLGGAVL